MLCFQRDGCFIMSSACWYQIVCLCHPFRIWSDETLQIIEGRCANNTKEDSNSDTRNSIYNRGWTDRSTLIYVVHCCEQLTGCILCIIERYTTRVAKILKLKHIRDLSFRIDFLPYETENRYSSMNLPVYNGSPWCRESPRKTYVEGAQNVLAHWDRSHPQQ